MRALLLLLAFGWNAPASASLPLASPVAAESRLIGELEPARLQGLLQRFVDKLYLKAFRHLGDERDFDHGHILFDPVTKKPVAILYHTQELAADQPPGSAFGYVDPGARNWIQWIGRDQIENAEGYLRKDYPRSAFWRWFEAERLPVLRRYRTIVDKMLDPARMGAETSQSLQWVFTRKDCADAAAGSEIDIRLPTGEKVCLALSAS